MTNLDQKTAYIAMLHFLLNYHKLTNSQSDDLASLLSSMFINENDGLPMDSGMWEEWEEAIEKTLSEKNLEDVKSHLTI
jgi:hypothetical protein